MAGRSLNLRKANINDLSILQKWMKEKHIKETIPDDDWNWEIELLRDPIWREQLIAEVEGEAIGFIQIYDPYLEETHYWGSIEPNLRAMDIWIGQKEFLGQGYGTKMMKLALNKCFENKEVTQVLVDPLANNPKAIKFYEHLGFKFLENRTWDNVNCAVYGLSREDFFR